MCKCFCLYLLQWFKLNRHQIDIPVMRGILGSLANIYGYYIEYPTKFGSIWDKIFLVDYLKGSNSWIPWKPLVKLIIIYALDHQLCKVSDYWLKVKRLNKFMIYQDLCVSWCLPILTYVTLFRTFICFTFQF